MRNHNIRRKPERVEWVGDVLVTALSSISVSDIDRRHCTTVISPVRLCMLIRYSLVYLYTVDNLHFIAY